MIEQPASNRGRLTVSKSALAAAALILAVGFALSAALAYYRISKVTHPYQLEISLVVADYNDVVRDWNLFVDEFNRHPGGVDRQDHERAVGWLRRTDRLANAAQVVIADWKSIQPPERYQESHVLAGRAMRATQSAFAEMSSYLDDVVRYGISFSDSSGRAASKLEEASRLLEQARAAAIAGR